MTDTPTVGDLFCHACGTAASPCRCPRRSTKTPEQLTDEIVRLQERAQEKEVSDALVHHQD